MKRGDSTMGIYLNPPADGFEDILKDDIYVDKTQLIAYTNQVLGTSRKLACFSRPRRFGKSFAVQMLAAYYSKGTQSALTDFYEYTMLEPGSLAEFVGFTEQEVSPKMKQYQMQKDIAYVIINEQLIGMKGQTINRQKIYSAKKNFTYEWKQLGENGVLTSTGLKFKK